MFVPVLLRTLLIAVIYTIAILYINDDYSNESLIRVGIQGLVFALVFGLVVWLLERWKGKKDRNN